MADWISQQTLLADCEEETLDMCPTNTAGNQYTATATSESSQIKDLMSCDGQNFSETWSWCVGCFLSRDGRPETKVMQVGQEMHFPAARNVAFLPFRIRIWQRYCQIWRLLCRSRQFQIIWYPILPIFNEQGNSRGSGFRNQETHSISYSMHILHMLTLQLPSHRACSVKHLSHLSGHSTPRRLRRKKRPKPLGGGICMKYPVSQRSSYPQTIMVPWSKAQNTNENLNGRKFRGVDR